MTSVPDLMPILSAGAHRDPSKGACIMEMASYLAGEEWSDRPQCTHPLIAQIAREVNDRLPDDRRHELLPLLPRIMGTASCDRVLEVRLAIWCAEQVAHLTGDEARSALDAARAWCHETTDVNQTRAYNAAKVAAKALTPGKAADMAAVFAAAGTTHSYNCTTAAEYAATAAEWDTSFLIGLLDEYDRLTGRTNPAPITADDTARLVALTH